MPPQRRGAWLDHRRLFLSPMMELRRQEEPALVVHYSVVARPPSGVFLTRQEQDLAPYLQLPEGLDPRFRSLARRAASGAGPEDPIRAAEAVARTLRSEYRYTLDLRGTSDERPLEDFLFRTRAGHCEFFSTAMALLLPRPGHPGPQRHGLPRGTAEPLRHGRRVYTVAQSDAHSWVEVYVDGLGWVAYDPTPAGRAEAGSSSRARLLLVELLDASRLAWEKNVVAYDLDSQIELLGAAWRASRSLRRELSPPSGRGARPKPRPPFPWVATALALVAVTAGGLLWWRRRRAGPRPGRGSPARGTAAAARAAALLARLDRALSREGAARPSSRTRAEHVARLAELGNPAAEPAGLVVGRYNEARFGLAEIDDTELARLEGLVRQAAIRAREQRRAARGPDKR